MKLPWRRGSGTARIGYRKDREDFPMCPRCGRVAERGQGPSLTVIER